MDRKDIGKTVVKQAKYIENTDIRYKGVFLGYDWNTICNWVRDNELYGVDVSGSTMIFRDEVYEPKEFQEIITAILDEAGEDELMVIN